MKDPRERKDGTYTPMGLQAILSDEFQLFCRHTFTSDTALKQIVVFILHPIRRTTDPNNCPQPSCRIHDPPTATGGSHFFHACVCREAR